MSFSQTYSAILRMILRDGLETPLARDIVRKSGFRPGSGIAPEGRPPVTMLRAVKFSSRTGPPSVDAAFLQYSGYTRRRFNSSLGARNTQAYTGFEAHMRFWLGGFTEVRVVGRVFTTLANLYLLCGFAVPIGPPQTFIANAKLPDTAAPIPSGLQVIPPPTSAIVTPLVAPYAVSPWVPIHESFLETEVECSVFVRNLNTSGNVTLDLGSTEIQLR